MLGLGPAETFYQGRVEWELELDKEAYIIVEPLKKVHARNHS